MTALTTKKSQDEAQTRAAMRWVCERDLFYLVKVVLNADRPDNKIGELHRELCEYDQTTPYRQNLYLLSRGHLKTSFLTVGKNIQRILRDPQIRILIASNKSENAEAMLSEIKGHLESPMLTWLYPDVLWPDPARQADKWTTSAITVKRKRRTKEATIETIGVTGELTSKHYDHGTFDDVVGKENSETRDLREGIKQFIRVSRSLFDPGSTRTWLGTPWHYDDAYAWLLELKAQGSPIGTFIRPCWVSDEQGEDIPGYGKVRLSYPEKWTVDELLAVRKEKGPAEFAAQYLIDPVPADTAYFPRTKAILRPRSEFPPLDTLWVVMAVDPAISQKKWADYSAIVTVGWDQDGKAWVLDIRRGKWPESETVAQIYDAHERVVRKGGHVASIGFEAIGFAKIFSRIFTAEGERRGFYLPVSKLERDTNAAKNTRIRALEPLWASQDLVFASDIPQLAEFLDEADRFRPDRESAHDDMLDALADTIQLRVKPDAKPRESLFDDPEMVERMEWEAHVQAERRKTKSPELDRTELRAMFNHQRRRAQWDAEREMASSAMGEW